MWKFIVSATNNNNNNNNRLRYKDHDDKHNFLKKFDILNFTKCIFIDGKLFIYVNYFNEFFVSMFS